MGGRVLRARSTTRVGLRCGASGSQGEVTVEEAEVGVTQPSAPDLSPDEQEQLLAHGVQRPRRRRAAAGTAGPHRDGQPGGGPHPGRRPHDLVGADLEELPRISDRDDHVLEADELPSRGGGAHRRDPARRDPELAYDDGPDRWIEVSARPLSRRGQVFAVVSLAARRHRAPPGRGGAAQRRAPPAGRARARGRRLRHPRRRRSADRRLGVAGRLVGPVACASEPEHRLRQPAPRRPQRGLAHHRAGQGVARASRSGPSCGSSTTTAASAGSS